MPLLVNELRYFFGDWEMEWLQVDAREIAAVQTGTSSAMIGFGNGYYWILLK
jgi:hypothetical protein